MKQKKLSGGARFLIAILSWLLGLALFVCAIATALIADVRVLTSEDNIRSFMHQLISAPVQLPGKAASRPGIGAPAVSVAGTRKLNMPHYNPTETSGFGLAEELINIVYDQIQLNSTEELTITKEDLQDIFDGSSAMDYIADKAAGLISDYYMDDVSTTFEAEEIVELMKDNAALIESLSGLPVDDEMINNVVNVWENNEIVDMLENDGLEGLIEYAEEQMGDVSVQEQLSSVTQQVGIVGVDSFKDVANMFRDITSKDTLLLGIGVCVGLILLILLCNIFQLGVGLRRCGYPLLLAGLGIIPCLLAVFVPNLWTGLPFLDVVRGILAQLTGIYGTIFGLGLVLIIAGIILSIHTNKNLRRVRTAVPVAAGVAPAAAPVFVEGEAPAQPEETSALPEEADPSLEDLLSGEPVAEEAPLEQPLCAPEEIAPEEAPAEEAPVEQPEEVPAEEEKPE